ncbi:uncharacterized protein LOC131242526 isoform X3 [Magnolia sinica]|uniref:uncharacterized protein LOC131242526 isoform X3 n=1 Tax=Magnolia sinica TaxID=86752 RepID=UPI002658FE77|nr:uncharacterized protein LOC131242526 isoform X3 [Magnolia sinica]
MNPTMMGRGADGGCGTEEKPCLIYRPPPRLPSAQTQTLDPLHFYTQAQKALSEHSPFDSEDAVSRVSTLPVGLSAFLSRCGDRRRRKHRKSHSESGAKASGQRGTPNVWVETEEYFRHIKLADIEQLVSKSDLGPAADACFSVPLLPESVGEGNVASTETESEKTDGASVNVAEVDISGSVNVAEEANNGVQEMEIDGAGPTDRLPLKELENSPSLHWLLGCKQKILLTSERPSKKRKLLGEEAGLERLVIACPSQSGDLAICHVCCSGDDGEQSNGLLFCDACNVSVHRKCYGVRDVPVDRWLCSWCNIRDRLETYSKPCFLCPKAGGALKPVSKDADGSETGGHMKFAHLFCGMWIPEVYVNDIEVMEPIVNIGGIKDTRRRLLCFLCKVKYGVCIRCSNGTCRTSFHPICAREAKLRMEIWGKFGCNNVELRAFCSKHSGSQDISSAQHSENLMSATAVGDSSATKLLPMTVPVNRPIKLKLSRRNGDKSMANDKITDGGCGEGRKTEVQVEQSTVPRRPECGDAQLIPNKETPRVIEKDSIGDANPSDSLNPVLILNELIDQGKATVSDVASELGISLDLLSVALVDERASFPPELQMKMVKLLRDSAHVGTSAQYLKFSTGSAISFGAKAAQTDAPNAFKEAGPGGSGIAPIVSLVPGRRIKSRIRISKAKKLVCSSGKSFGEQNGNGILLINDGISENSPVLAEVLKQDGTSDESPSGDRDCLFKEPEITGKDHSNYSSHAGTSIEYGKAEVQSIIETLNSHDTGVPAYVANNIYEIQQQSQSMVEKELLMRSGNGHAEIDVTVQNNIVESNGEHPDCVTRDVADINKKLMQMQKCGVLQQKSRSPVCHGQKEKGMFSMKATCPASICCIHPPWNSTCTDLKCTSDAARREQSLKARTMGILELSPEDEVEGEIVYFQSRLLDNAVANKHHFESLISRVVKNLPHELDALCKQRWDAVLVSQFLRQVREAKKQGRKERRHKEAQAVLAAATATAAASSRISSFRKDVHDESLLKVDTVSGRAGPFSQLIPRTKETLSRLDVSKISSEFSEVFRLTTDFPKEHRQSCDICRRNETVLNHIVVCCNCKVAVHLGCYNGLKDPVGPWYCELCEELLLQSTSPRIRPINTQESSCFITHCGLCGGATGAFRKSTDGQWVHAFCAEWVLESTFRRGQPNPVGGMETISKERDLLVCCICRRKHGVCIKCNHDDCQTAFHPTCAKRAGLHMDVKTAGGKFFQHKAYCEKHSLDQKKKAESLQHGPDEVRRIKQIRVSENVELEKVRLLCERIIKREKLKRELVLCSHDILASKRDNVAFSVLVRSSFFPPDLSSGSVTTSLKGHADDNKSCGDAMQRSDDITVDSTVSGTSQVTFPVHLDIDRKTDDSFTSRLSTCKPIDRLPFSGKQLPHRPASVASRDSADDGENRLKSRKHTATFQKELIMTSDQASMQNLRLPKGYVYIPVGSLPKEKPVSRDTVTPELLDPDG